MEGIKIEMLNKDIPKITIIIFFLHFTLSYSYAEFTGNIMQNWSKSTYEVKNVSKQESSYYNINTLLNYYHPFTNTFSFSSSLRTFYRINNYQDPTNERKDKYYEVSPDFVFYLTNPVYQIRIGNIISYKKFDSSVKTQNQERKENFYYTTFNLTPYKLPSLFLNTNYKNTSETLGNLTKESKSSDFLLTSNYNFDYKKLRGSYYLSYFMVNLSTPDEEIYKTKGKTLSGSFDLNYSDSYLKAFINPYLSYRMTFSQSKNQWFSKSKEANILIDGTGLYANGSLSDPFPYLLNATPELTNKDYSNATNINLKDLYQNIGIKFIVPSQITKIRLYIKEYLPDLQWKIFIANDPIIGYQSWTEISGFNIATGIYDNINNIYYIDFIFINPVESQYIKVVNQNSSAQNAYITEIEAYQKKVFTTGEASQEYHSIIEEFNFSLRHNITEKLSIDEGFYLRRMEYGDFDQWSSLGKVFSSFNNLSKKKIGEPYIEINRGYFGNLRYNIKVNLQSSLSFQRSETVNNIPNRYYSNSYRWSTFYNPLDRLSFVLSLNRVENFLYNEKLDKIQKSTIDDSLILNISSKIYKELQWTSDNGFRKSESYINNSTSKGIFTNHLINIPLTRKVSWYLNTSWERNTVENLNGKTQQSQNYRLSSYITYRPGTALNFSYGLNFNRAKFEKEKKEYFAHNFYINWRITRVLLLTSGLNFYEYKPEGNRGWGINGIISWYPRKFLDFRLMYNLVNTKVDSSMQKETSLENISLWVNFRF